MRETEPMEKNRTTPKGLAVAALSLGAMVLASWDTTSTVFADPPGLTVVVDGKDFGKSPAKIESTGTTFGDYHLEVKDENGKVVHEQDLPKAVRIWGIFWPPYVIFYNMYRLNTRYIVQSIKSPSAETTWLVITPP